MVFGAGPKHRQRQPVGQGCDRLAQLAVFRLDFRHPIAFLLGGGLPRLRHIQRRPQLREVPLRVVDGLTPPPPHGLDRHFPGPPKHLPLALDGFLQFLDLGLQHYPRGRILEAETHGQQLAHRDPYPPATVGGTARPGVVQFPVQFPEKLELRNTDSVGFRQLGGLFFFVHEPSFRFPAIPARNGSGPAGAPFN